MAANDSGLFWNDWKVYYDANDQEEMNDAAGSPWLRPHEMYKNGCKFNCTGNSDDPESGDSYNLWGKIDIVPGGMNQG
jgi:hypothetical protein